jgi:hypothetical protein
MAWDDKVVYLDTETTSLDYETGEVWEIGFVTKDPGGANRQQEHLWEATSTDWWHCEFQVPVDHLETADPMSLQISGFYDRYPFAFHGSVDALEDPDYHDYVRAGAKEKLLDLVLATHGKHLVGAVIAFDEYRLTKLLRSYGLTPAWNYHSIDIEPVALGYLHGRGIRKMELPITTSKINEALGLPPQSEESRHTALGDALEVKKIAEAMVNDGATFVAT